MYMSLSAPDFGKEDTSFITDEMVIKCINQGIVNGVFMYIEIKCLDYNHHLNKTMFIKDVDVKYVKVRQSYTYISMPINKALVKMIDANYGYLREFYLGHKEVEWSEEAREFERGKMPKQVLEDLKMEIIAGFVNYDIILHHRSMESKVLLDTVR